MFKVSGQSFSEISTKEELKELLEKYKSVINTHMSDYLDCLIELEVPVTKDYIYPDQREVLAQLDIYRKISVYNIYALSLGLLNKLGENYNLKVIDRNGMLQSKFDGNYIFNFDYRNINSNRDGETVSIFQTVENEEVKKEELDRVLNKLNELYNETNPFPSQMNVCGAPGDFWTSKHSDDVRRYEELFEKLDKKRELSSKEKKLIEFGSDFQKVFFETFGLDEESFSEGLKYPFYESSSCLEKRLVKKMPFLTIENNVKYI